jgi:hypothetical protein
MDSYEKLYGVAIHEARFERALRISKIAKNILSEKETRWSDFVKHDLFGELIRSARRAEGRELSDPRQLIEIVKL